MTMDRSDNNGHGHKRPELKPTEGNPNCETQHGNPSHGFLRQEIFEKRHKFLELSVERSAYATIWADSHSNLVFVNNAACRMLERTKEELLGLQIKDINPEFPIERWFSHWNELKIKGNSTFETSLKTSKDRLFPVEVFASFIEFCDKQYNCFFARDITEQKHAQEALTTSEALYRSLIDNIQDVFYRSDLQGRLLMGSPSGARLFGYDTVEEMIGLPLTSFWVNSEEREKLLNEIAKHGKVKDFEGLLKKKNGEVFVASFTTHFYYDDNGVVQGTEGIIRDVTERKMLQDQLISSQKMEAIGTLAGGIAHDFNNLLQVIRGNAQMALLSVKQGDPGHSHLAAIQQAAKSASDLTKGLLTFSRRVEGNFKPLDLNKELMKLRSMLIRTIPKMILVNLDMEKDLNAISADPSQIQQLIMNLAINARDAMPDGGAIEIKTENIHLNEEEAGRLLGLSPGKHVRLSISDSGTGIDKTNIERIYEPFFTTKAPGQGTGLGLSIAYGIVETHNGYITCHSEPSNGATFKIYFPAISAPLEEETEDKTKELTRGSETILIVDDETEVRTLGEELLSSFGYTTLSASNGEEAVKVYEKNCENIDLVLLDLVMPKMDGIQCVRRLREINPDVKIVIASGFASNGRVEDALNLGAVASIQKPYDIDEILSLLRTLLD